MSTHVDTLVGLGQMEVVRLTTTGGTTVEARVNQQDFEPRERLRLELVPPRSGTYARFQLRASAEGGEWSPVSVRAVESGGEKWVDLGAVADVESRGTVQ